MFGFLSTIREIKKEVLKILSVLNINSTWIEDIRKQEKCNHDEIQAIKKHVKDTQEYVFQLKQDINALKKCKNTKKEKKKHDASN